MPLRIDLPREQIAEFCQRWGITEFAFFGSVLRDDFGPESDVDVLVRLTPNSGLTLLDVAQMERQLTELLGRNAHLATWNGVEQSGDEILKESILDAAETVYAA